MGIFMDELNRQAAGATSSIVGAGLGMALGAYNDRRQLKQQERLQNLQIKGQKDLMTYQQSQAYDMWLKTGPQGQKEQLELAGLNPALMYGMGGGTGGQTVTPSGGASGSQAPGGGQEALQGMGMMLNMRMQQAQIELAESQARKNQVEADKTAGVDTTKAWTEIENIVANTENTRQQRILNGVITDLKALELDINTQTYDDAISLIESEAELARQDVARATRDNRIGNATEEQVIKQVNFGYALMAAQKAMLDSQTRLNKANVGLTQAQTKLAQKNTQLSDAQITAVLRKSWQDWDQVATNMQNANTAEKNAAINEKAQQLAEDLAVPEMIGRSIFGLLIGAKLGTTGPAEVKGFRR